MPPSVSGAMLEEWWELRNGRHAVRDFACDRGNHRNFEQYVDSGGWIEGSRAASINLPAPGESIISM
jgi:hypothetical protein